MYEDFRWRYNIKFHLRGCLKVNVLMILWTSSWRNNDIKVNGSTNSCIESLLNNGGQTTCPADVVSMTYDDANEWEWKVFVWEKIYTYPWMDRHLLRRMFFFFKEFVKEIVSISNMNKSLTLKEKVDVEQHKSEIINIPNAFCIKMWY